ncbi:single-stranded DNA-binding protein [Lysinibacillus sp. SGAir0095]|uniref:single-stranded DNA-binding protein n=1 Tax=Lysinibacillus sp. SGAir0095 TaxID=2070463 RepID=UPI0010CCB76D|nr:single-stranded DNA-binding protein [Lysinibacillus sp. SGAir0095]QCR31447.1 single-stranded DNA-binding protein [Lysinibacillus sp. SGAir0095]
MNQVGLVGRLTRDPVLKIFSENRVQTNFVIAINRNYRNNQGNVEADFVNCIAWGRLAERVVNYCGKGSLVAVNGRLQTRSFTNKENVKIYTTEVIVDDVRFLILKTPENKNSTTQNNHDVTKDFVLPEQVENTPVP